MSDQISIAPSDAVVDQPGTLVWSIKLKVAFGITGFSKLSFIMVSKQTVVPHSSASKIPSLSSSKSVISITPSLS